jgi:hypothetical protein
MGTWSRLLLKTGGGVSRLNVNGHVNGDVNGPQSSQIKWFI